MSEKYCYVCRKTTGGWGGSSAADASPPCEHSSGPPPIEPPSDLAAEALPLMPTSQYQVEAELRFQKPTEPPRAKVKRWRCRVCGEILYCHQISQDGKWHMIGFSKTYRRCGPVVEEPDAPGAGK
jgi:hypothetical protein